MPDIQLPFSKKVSTGEALLGTPNRTRTGISTLRGWPPIPISMMGAYGAASGTRTHNAFPHTCFPSRPTTSYRTAADGPTELFSHYFITADRTGSRNTR